MSSAHRDYLGSFNVFYMCARLRALWKPVHMLERCSCKKINIPWCDLKIKLNGNPDIKDAPVKWCCFVCPTNIVLSFADENHCFVQFLQVQQSKHRNPWTVNRTEGSTESVGDSGETWCFFCKPAKGWKDRQILELRINQSLSPWTAPQIEIEPGGEVALNSAWLHIVGHLTSCC